MHKDSARLGQSGSNLMEIVVCGAFQIPLAVNQSHGTVQTSTRTKAGAIMCNIITISSFASACDYSY